jgi:hypothetical protein
MKEAMLWLLDMCIQEMDSCEWFMQLAFFMKYNYICWKIKIANSIPNSLGCSCILLWRKRKRKKEEERSSQISRQNMQVQANIVLIQKPKKKILVHIQSKNWIVLFCSTYNEVSFHLSKKWKKKKWIMQCNWWKTLIDSVFGWISKKFKTWTVKSSLL